MSFVDSPSGWHLPGIAATATVHAVLLAVAALAFQVADPQPGEDSALPAVTFSLPAPPGVVGAPDAEQPSDQPGKRVIPPAHDSSQAVAAQAAPPAFPLPAAERPAAQAASRVLPSPVLPSAMTAPAPVPSASDSEADLLAAYSQQLRERIQERRPRGLRKEGAVIVAFSLDRAGRITEALLARSSGDVQLDRLALRMVRQASPFPPPVPEIPSAKLTFAIPIRFH